MVTVKRWMYTKRPDTFGEDDIMWLKGLKCRVECFNKRIPFAQGNTTSYMSGGSEIIVTTVTDKQKDMLTLKYGNDMVLMSMFVIKPGEQLRDNWGIISVGLNHELY